MAHDDGGKYLKKNKSEATALGKLDHKPKISSPQNLKTKHREETTSEKNTVVHSMFAAIIYPKDKSRLIYTD